MERSLRVSVVIVNYNGAELLPDCLAGLEAQTRAADEVIVVDNASTDSSISLMEEQFPWARIVPSGANLGFSGGNNLGIRSSSGEIIVLLNNDTIPSPGFVEEIVSPLERDESISAVSGVLTFTSDPVSVATSGIDVFDNGLALDRDLGSDWRTLPAEQPVFGPTGGAAAFRRSVLDQTDLFPEPFFLYLEDADLAWRLRLQGFQTVTRTAAWAQHIYSASSVEGSPAKDYFLARNRAWVLIRCWPSVVWRENWWRVLVYELGVIAYSLATRRWNSITGRLAGWIAIMRLWKVRSKIQCRRRITDDNLIYWIHAAPSVRNIFRLRDVVKERTARNERVSPVDTKR